MNARALCNVLFEVALVILLCYLYWKSGYARALRDQEKFGHECYQRGRNDEAKWWIDSESAVRDARSNLPRKERQA
jgi:hypothetical protein